MTNKLAIAMIWKGTRSLTSNFFHKLAYENYLLEMKIDSLNSLR